MKVVLDTNVFVSGVFFGGVPGRILSAWRDNAVTLVVSPEILDEYGATGQRLAADFPAVDLDPLLALVAKEGIVVQAPPLPETVCDDPDDDIFLACAIASRAEIVVSGDRALLRASGYGGVEVLSPRTFVDRYLEKL